MTRVLTDGIQLLLAMTIFFAGATTVTADRPVFSWDTVPVCLHFGSNTRMTDAQVEMAAKLSNLICLEKAHGRSTDPVHCERVAAEDAARIKRLNLVQSRLREEVS